MRLVSLVGSIRSDLCIKAMAVIVVSVLVVLVYSLISEYLTED